MTSKKPPPPQYEVFERIGESQTRLELGRGTWGDFDSSGEVVVAAKEWLRLNEEARAATELAATRASESRAARWARHAAFAAYAAAAIAGIGAYDKIVQFIQWLR